MKKWTTKCGNTIYQVLNGRSNSFLISKDNNHVLVDTGRKNSMKTLEEKLNGILNGDRLSALVLTHTHFDHAENAAEIKDKYHAKVIVQMSEAEHLKQGNTSLPSGTNFLTKILVNSIGKKLQPHYNYRSVDPDVEVDETYDLKPFGVEAYIIHTPGHSKGSLTVLVDGEVALVGDTMFGVLRGSVFPPFADDPVVMIESWDKLLKTGSQIFLPGHGGEKNREQLKKDYAKRAG